MATIRQYDPADNDAAKTANNNLSEADHDGQPTLTQTIRPQTEFIAEEARTVGYATG
jgi:hypothetical protein